MGDRGRFHVSLFLRLPGQYTPADWTACLGRLTAAFGVWSCPPGETAWKTGAPVTPFRGGMAVANRYERPWRSVPQVRQKPKHGTVRWQRTTVKNRKSIDFSMGNRRPRGTAYYRPRLRRYASRGLLRSTTASYWASHESPRIGPSMRATCSGFLVSSLDSSTWMLTPTTLSGFLRDRDPLGLAEGHGPGRASFAAQFDGRATLPILGDAGFFDLARGDLHDAHGVADHVRRSSAPPIASFSD